MAWPRRQRTGYSKLFPLQPAIHAVDALERKVCFYQADCKFSVDEVFQAVIPEDVLQILRAAYPHAADRGEWYRNAEFTTPAGNKFELDIRLGDARMLIPRTKPVLQPVPHAGEFASMLDRVHDAHLKYQQVRRVIHWLNNYATLGACKFYFPSVACLLPTDHPFHSIGTRGYHEPKKPISEIANDIREAIVTLATGMLLPELNNKHKPTLFSVDVITESNGGSQSLELIAEK